MVLLGVQVCGSGRRLLHRLLHHAPEEEPRCGRAGSGQDWPGVRGPHHPADHDEGAAPGYNKDMQEDKEALFDAIDTVEVCLPVFAAMVNTLSVRRHNMERAAAGGFINATDCADYLTKKGMPSGRLI